MTFGSIRRDDSQGQIKRQGLAMHRLEMRLDLQKPPTLLQIGRKSIVGVGREETPVTCAQ